MIPHLMEEDLCLLEDVLKFYQIQQVPLQSLLVGVDFLHFHLQGLKSGLQVRETTNIP